MYIYKITNLLNSKVYIGQTTRSVQERYQEHCRHSKAQTAIDRAIKHYGADNFTVVIITVAETIDELNRLEKRFIKYYNSMNPKYGYNMCEGGSNTSGFRHSDVSRKRMSESRMGIFEGVKNPFYGKHHTEESKQKMSLAKRGKKQSAEWIRNSHIPLQKPVICVTTGERFKSVADAGKAYGIAPTHISRACRETSRLCKGLKFIYDNTVPSPKGKV